MGKKNPMYCKHFSEEHKRKIGLASKGRVHTPDARKKISDWHTGRPRSEYAKRKISEGRKGIRLSEEHKKNLSEAMIGKNNPNYGRKWTDEMKIKMVEARRISQLNKNHRYTI